MQPRGDVVAEAATDRETSRRWTEMQGGRPAAVARTHRGGEAGMVRIMFADAPQSEHQALTEISSR